MASRPFCGARREIQFCRKEIQRDNEKEGSKEGESVLGTGYNENKFDKRYWNLGGDFLREIIWDQRVVGFAACPFSWWSRRSRPVYRPLSTTFTCFFNKSDNGRN